MATRTFALKSVLLFSLLFLFGQFANAQSGLCDPNTPFYIVNLTGQPNGTWVSNPPIQRAGNCCGTTAPDRCIEFSITLDAAAVAINFQIASGAVPPGALFYQINCGPPVAVGSPICLNGPGPYTLTFCKPGNNLNTYAITSIAGPMVSPDVATSDGCSVTMGSTGLNLTSITWNSIAPGSYGQYNNYLSCQSGCDTTVVTPQVGYPAFVDYVICGMPAAGVCASTQMYCDTIRANFLPPVVNAINPNPAAFCVNEPGVTLNGIINGGAPPYTFIWTNTSGIVVGSTQNYFATTPGTYTLEVRDTTYPRCPAKFTSVNVTVHQIPTALAGTDVTVCPGNSTVQLNGTVSNATGGIWTGGTGTFSPSNTSLSASYTPSAAEVAAGFVILTLTSTGNGPCAAAVDQVRINITQPLTVSVTPPYVICYGTLGNLTANVTGGTAPYQYSWNTGQTTQSVSNVPPGSYTVTITDATSNACTTQTSVTITQNPQIFVNVPSNSIVSCDSTVLVTVSASGGGGSYSYVWNTGATTPSISVNTGTYIITAYDNYGCTARDTVIIQAANSGIAVAVNQPGILCNGTTATLTATASGGFGGYTYSWSNGLNSSSINVPAGSFCITLTDSVGCITTSCVQVQQQPPIVVSIPPPPLICFGSTTTINAMVSGGTAPYSYSWNTGASSSMINVPAGSYTVTIRDANPGNCTSVANVTVNQAPQLTANVNNTPVTCNGGMNGSATVTANGGTTPYSYAWAPYGGNGPSAFGLVAGTYSVTVIDNIGCTQITPVIITEPPLLVMSAPLTTPVTCFGGNNGTASVTVSGGTSPYSFSWSGAVGSLPNASGFSAGPNTVTVTDFQGCAKILSFVITEPPAINISVTAISNVSCYAGNNGSATVNATGGTAPYTYYWWETGGTTATQSNLYTGTYNISVRDSFNCVANTTVTINQPTLLQSSITSSTNIACNGDANGAATVTASGGFGAYTYSWSPSGATTPSVNNLSGGNHTATITDGNGCQTTASVNIIEPPVFLFVSAGAFPANCYGVCDGIAVVIPDGGTQPYTYSWFPGGATLPSLTNLCAGNYLCTVVDANGCVTDTLLTVTEPPPFNISSSGVSARCFFPSGSATATATGSSAPFSYTWSTSPVQTGQTANSLLPGTYTVTVTDSRSCQQTDTVIVGNLPGVAATLQSSTDANCYGACDGTASVQASGGITPYTYSWSTTPATITSTTTTLCTGTQSVVVTDAFGCKDTVPVFINQPSPVVISIAGQSDTICIGQSATLTAAASGGTSPYNYSWSTGSSSPSIFVSPTVTTTYTVTARDGKNCASGDSTFVVNVYPGITAVAVSDAAICNGDSITLSATATGGNGNYTYTWTPGPVMADSITVSPSATTTYTVRINDNCGTPTATDDVLVTINPLPNLAFSASASEGCAPLCVTFTDESTASGGTITGWNWDFGNGTSSAQNPVHCFTSPSSYNVTLTAITADGCIKSQTFTNFVTINPDPVAMFTLDPKEVLTTGPAVHFTDQSIGAATWLWTFGDPGDKDSSTAQNPVHLYSDTGVYCATLIVTSVDGCVSSTEHCVIVKPDATIYLPNSFSPNGDGVNDYFFAQGTFIDEFKMDVFDRWGNLLYSANDFDDKWDGRANGGRMEAQEDVYIYQVYYKTLGNTVPKTFRGTVTLVK